ncbi:ABC-ATPase domain-containing protein [Texcoconibacillus texcoconensis]|uniref:Putative ABC-class ATPase n=1 Tax=Texcoconibacillus texcoconensis TaxID=1095777 RepID=A0A840QQS9_9BACI|nr:ABC-ATPase domain-containing protein [Texcoconibacillus texcoconensis]MBB5173657.1 putative ABC-class ATPase [Texcoconibacillus texcoconensis]
MQQLKKQLQQLDGKGYKAYKDIHGTYNHKDFTLHIDYVQGDPFAAPSRIRLIIDHHISGLKKEWFSKKHQLIATEDFFAREVAHAIHSENHRKKGTGKSGLIKNDSPGQEILERSAVKIDEQQMDIRLSIGLPAQGRKILGSEAARLLCEAIPTIIRQATQSYSKERLHEHITLMDEQMEIRTYLKKHGYVAFVANQSLLPRESGVSNKPLKGDHVIRFQSPKNFEVTIPLSTGTSLTGMAIPKGVSLIIGGGYHGKSTLLQAIERGVYNHIAEDGREYVITDDSAFKVRSEDGRSVRNVNISPFIANLPFQKSTSDFDSEDASGSTSQAANILEALEIGSKTLLIDEDTSATNFMIRDGRMQKLVSKDKEPITPFIDNVRALYEELDVSTILVIGGSGDYFNVADHVIMLDEYKPYDVTEKAKVIASEEKDHRNVESSSFSSIEQNRSLPMHRFKKQLGNKEKVDAKGLHHIRFGYSDINLSMVEQLIDSSQTQAIALILKKIAKTKKFSSMSLNDTLDELYERIGDHRLDDISPFRDQHPGDLALPRKLEVAAAINRFS